MHRVKIQGGFKQIKRYKEGKWKPGSVFVTKHIKEVMDVKVKIGAVQLGLHRNEHM